MALAQPFVFDPYAVDVQENPYPYYAVLRNEHPLYWCANANTWALSRYPDGHPNSPTYGHLKLPHLN